MEDFAESINICVLCTTRSKVIQRRTYEEFSKITVSICLSVRNQFLKIALTIKPL